MDINAYHEAGHFIFSQLPVFGVAPYNIPIKATIWPNASIAFQAPRFFHYANADEAFKIKNLDQKKSNSNIVYILRQEALQLIAGVVSENIILPNKCNNGKCLRTIERDFSSTGDNKGSMNDFHKFSKIHKALVEVKGTTKSQEDFTKECWELVETLSNIPEIKELLENFATHLYKEQTIKGNDLKNEIHKIESHLKTQNLQFYLC